MKILFCHDGPMEKDDKSNYYSVGFNDNLFKRYEVISSDIYIAMRVHNNVKNTEKKLDLSKDKYKVIECPNISSAKGLINIKKCKKIIENAVKDMDLLIVRLPSMIGNLAVSIANKYNKPYVIELVGCPWDALWNHSFTGKFMAPYMYLRTKKIVKNAKYVIYVTNQFLQKRYPTSGKNIGCSDVELAKNNDSNIMMERKEKINKLDKKIVLGTIGYLNVKYKGQQYVIQAIKELIKEGYDIEYQLVGNGNKRRLENIAKKYNVLKNVNFIGTLSHDEVFQWLKKIDLYIQPSTTEGMPRSVIEAMSVGCPCIGSNVGGIPELIDKRYIFSKKNVLQISKKIKEIIDARTMLEMSETQISNAQIFSTEILTEQRKMFLNKIKEEINEERKSL